MSDLYDVARQVTDEVLGEGTYAEVNAGNPDPGVRAAIQRSPGSKRRQVKDAVHRALEYHCAPAIVDGDLRDAIVTEVMGVLDD